MGVNAGRTVCLVPEHVPSNGVIPDVFRRVVYSFHVGTGTLTFIEMTSVTRGCFSFPTFAQNWSFYWF